MYRIVIGNRHVIGTSAVEVTVALLEIHVISMAPNTKNRVITRKKNVEQPSIHLLVINEEDIGRK